jgi:hypothetical protein
MPSNTTSNPPVTRALGTVRFESIGIAPSDPSRSRPVAARRGPYLEPRELSERNECLPDRARCPEHEDALAGLHLGLPVKELVGGRPGEDQRGCLRRIDPDRYAYQVVCIEVAVPSVRARNGERSDTVADAKTNGCRAHAIDIPHHVVTEHEGRLST